MTEANPVVLMVVTAIVASVDIFFLLVTFGWVKGFMKLMSKLDSNTLRSVPVADDEAHRTHPDYKGKLAKTPDPGITTLYGMAKNSFEKYGDRPCMAEREFMGWKSAKVREFGKTSWKTYAEISKEAHKFGAALRAAGMVPAPDTTNLDQIKTPCRMAIFENTCPQWMTGCIGAFTQGITVVTVYATLGMDAVIEAVVDNSIQVLLCNKKDVSKVAEKMSKMPTLKTIVYTNDQVAASDKIDLPNIRGVKIVSFSDFVASGDTKGFPPSPPKPDSCAVVMYTSGSTGKPKGVLITHSQALAAATAFCLVLGLRAGEDVYLAYLPCAHILELLAEFTNMSLGIALVYADPKSLTATGAYPMGALEQYKPTLMAAVPKIWDVIKKGIQAKLAQSSSTLQLVVEAAFRWRIFLQSHGFDVSSVIDKALFGKIKAATGGNLRMGLSGGGPLNLEVQHFSRAAFGISMGQGYGLTETCAALTVQAMDDYRGQIAGVPVPSMEIKLESTPDVTDKAGIPYLSTDRYDVDGNPIFGRGEVCCKGNNVAVGYYMMPDKTKEAFSDDGWFHTGDIGQFTSDGSLKIIDRKKNLVKLKGGEYIALEKMEMVYGNSSFVDAATGGICCYGDGDMDRPVALLQVSENVVKKWAKANGKQDEVDSLLKSAELEKAVLKDLLAQHASSNELSGLEKLVGVGLLNDPWTPENGCLTAANKLQRRAVISKFEKVFEETKKKGIF